MIVNPYELPESLRNGMEPLEDYGFLQISEQGVQLIGRKGESVTIQKSPSKVVITYDTEPHFYMALARSIGISVGNHSIKPQIKDLGLMLDCSRNAVAKPDLVKRLLCMMALMGYTYLELYTEDTYELPGEPYFGYKRGRYSAKELTEMIDFAEIFGIEVVPCIQTLAHLSHLANWQPYFDHMDIDDILLVGDERTYALIRKMLTFCREVFRTDRINVGLDEAFFLGRGQHQNLHGYRPKHEIYMEHMKKVFDMCKELGLKPEFWADGFDDYGMTKEQIQSVFDGTQTPVYWNYEVDGKFKETFTSLKECAGKVIYAGSFWTFLGYAPDNRYSDRVQEKAFVAAVECGLEDILMTAWGDDGGECSIFASVPTMWHATELLYPIEADKDKVLKELTGYTDKEWRMCDLVNTVLPEIAEKNNALKYMLHNDFLLGVMDANIPDFAGDVYKKMLPTIKRLARKESPYAYIFQAYASGCSCLVKKATYSKRLYQAYQEEDRVMMQKLIKELGQIRLQLQEFYKAYRRLWMKENKGFGFEILDARIGGLIGRTETVEEVLKDYLAGKTDRIYELEEERIDFFCGNLEGDKRYTPMHNGWSTHYTVNHI